MPYQFSAGDFRYISLASINGTFPSIGFLSEFITTGPYSTININCKSDKNTTFNLYSNISLDDATKVLHYSQVLPPNTNFSKKFQIQAGFFQVELNNDDSLEGSVFLYTSVSQSNQFSTQTFLNSNININDNSNLVRVSNDYGMDLVRGIHSDFEKININGILESNPLSEVTIGLGDNYIYDAVNFDASLVVAGANDNQPAGTGARYVRIKGTLDTGAQFNSLFDVNTGTGLMGLSISSVDSMEITEVGSLTHNEGSITITGSAGKVLGFMGATTNFQRAAYYKVPSNKELVIGDIQVSGYSQGGTIKVYIYNPATTIEYSIADFHITTNPQMIDFKLQKTITSGEVLKVNYVPDVAGDVLININVNATLAPTISSF